MQCISWLATGQWRPHADGAWARRNSLATDRCHEPDGVEEVGEPYRKFPGVLVEQLAGDGRPACGGGPGRVGHKGERRCFVVVGQEIAAAVQCDAYQSPTSPHEDERWTVAPPPSHSKPEQSVGVCWYSPWNGHSQVECPSKVVILLGDGGGRRGRRGAPSEREGPMEAVDGDMRGTAGASVRCAAAGSGRFAGRRDGTI